MRDALLNHVEISSYRICQNPVSYDDLVISLVAFKKIKQAIRKDNATYLSLRDS